MEKLLKVGEAIPKFEAKDFEGERITSDDLIGAPFVIYFYPKDDTPGCTQQACGFRDLMEGFEDIDVMVVGVSPDSPASHQSFIDKHELNFPLISDEKFDVATKFGVAKKGADGKLAIVRSTFICDGDGIVQWVESPVNVDGHAERVLAAIEEVLA